MARPTLLTQRQENFVRRYLECGNASEAYRYAYQSKMTPKQINEKASLLLSQAKVSQRVVELQEITQKNSEIKKERILDELSAILEARITDYVDLKNGVLSFKDFSSLTDAQVRAIESVKETRNGLELKLHGKSWTIDRICKMLGFDAPSKHELTGPGGRGLFENLADNDLDEKIKALQNLTE